MLATDPRRTRAPPAELRKIVRNSESVPTVKSLELAKGFEPPTR